jgi:hypothetical protein
MRCGFHGVSVGGLFGSPDRVSIFTSHSS